MNAPSPTENTALALASASAGALLLHEASMERLERIADLMASGKTTVPAHLRGSKGDCFAIVLQSMQWGMNPFAVAQKTHLVNGTLGYEAQLVAAVINSSGAVQDRFHFEWFGPWEKVIGKFLIKKGEKGEYRTPGWTLEDEVGCGIKVSATLKGEKEPRILELLLAQARVRNSTLWADDPKQQLAYLAQKRWSRLFAPDVILGVYTPDEIAEPGEKFMGAADEVPPTGAPAPAGSPATGPAAGALHPADSEEAFEKRLLIYRTYLSNGKTHDEIVAFIKGKRELTAEQEKRVRELKPAVPATGQVTDVQPKEQPGADSDAPVMAYAQVADRITKAADVDQLAEAEDLIGSIADAQQRKEAVDLAAARRAELTKEA